MIGREGLEEGETGKGQTSIEREGDATAGDSRLTLLSPGTLARKSTT